MKSTILLPLLGVIPIALSGCPQPPPPGPTARALLPACSTTDLMNKVRFLQTPFDPRVDSSPQPSSLGVPANIQDDLQSAFAIAPTSFKAKLCDLTYIFIDPTGCANPLNCMLPDVQLAHDSWGLRGYRSGDSGKYVATSAGLWRNGGSAPKLSDYEVNRLEALLQQLNPNAGNWLRGPSSPHFATAAPNTPAMAVLAALAHETGHVFWYDAFVPVRGGAIDLNNFCGGHFYTPGSWNNVDVPVGRWIDFAQPARKATHNPDYVSILNSHLSQSNFAQAGATLLSVLQSQDLASVLAAFSPHEDFVETYEWYVLLNAVPPLSNLTIQIPGLPPLDIAGAVANKPALRSKMACF
jgi:hypothetical protein